MYTAVDLFAGAGGLSLGFKQTQRFDIKVAFENNPQMQETYRKNHCSVELHGDVCNADYSAIKEKYGDIDVVIGGPPCQGFSSANRQIKHAVNQNNNLVKEYVRAVLELKPKAFVMENVGLLQSDIHRFYLRLSDVDLILDRVIRTRDAKIFLLDSEYVFDGVINLIKDGVQVNDHIWPDSDYSNLNVIYKFRRNPQKLRKTLEKYKTRLIKAAGKYTVYSGDDYIRNADREAFNAILDYYDGKIDAENIHKYIAPSIMYQRMLSKSNEIRENELYVEEYSLDNGLCAKVLSFSVFEYLKAMLCPRKGEIGYQINFGILNAADFGAPQKRMRFIMMGIRSDVADSVELPRGQFEESSYRTVFDAIKDLEDIEPIFDVFSDSGIRAESKDDLSELAETLRDSDIIYNHVTTKSTDIAIKRFKALRQGQNFHSLDDELIVDSYTDISRTQNTVYLRLDYSKPSGTVINVRKSMWIHPTKDRAVSIREAARLQAFPDSYVFYGSKDKQYQQVGNAVPPILAKAIAEALADQLDEALKVKV